MVRVAALRAVYQRLSPVLLILIAVALMMLGKVDALLVEQARTRVTDAVAPIMEAMSSPARSIAGVVGDVQELSDLREQNAKLLQENAELTKFREAAFKLEAENLSLRTLLNLHTEQPHSFVTARVVGDNSGAFVRSLAVNLGKRAGLRDGLAVLGGAGLIGRLVQTGDWSARVLLLTDLNARMPVIVERTRTRAVLAGDNSAEPQLIYLPPDGNVQIGDRIVTSGHGGMFPAGIPVGTVSLIGEKEFRVTPMEALEQIEYVKIVDFRPGGEDGGVDDPILRPNLALQWQGGPE
ncbi:MAG: rod shape-determining protein MreC [Pseudomonadota bacterium]